MSSCFNFGDRAILYPSLEDHPIVRGYPAVQGMQKDVFFFDHTHPENSSEDSMSKFNTFEVRGRSFIIYNANGHIGGYGERSSDVFPSSGRV